MRLHGNRLAVLTATLTVATGGGVAWACGSGHSDPGAAGTGVTGQTAWTGATGTTGAARDTNARRHARRNARRHSRRA